MSGAFLVLVHVQGYSEWLSGYNCPAVIPHQIRETTTIWQFHSKVVCTVSRDRVRVYPGIGGTNQNRHWNHHRWHATDSLERTRLSCWCLWNHKGCTYRALVRYVRKTWSVILLNKKIHVLLSQVYCVRQVVKTPTIILNNPVLSYAIGSLSKQMKRSICISERFSSLWRESYLFSYSELSSGLW